MKFVRPITVTEGMIVSYTLPETDYPAWSSSTVYSIGDRVIDTTTHRVYESLRGEKNTDVSITIASPAVIAWTAHTLEANSKVRFSTTGALPTGITAGTDYYVSATGLSPNSFSISATAGGTQINTTGTQSGTHTAIEILNVNFDPTDPDNTATGSTVTDTTMWLEVGGTNKWRVFDQQSVEQTENTDIIEISLIPGRFDTIGFLNVEADDITVTITDPTEGVVFDETRDTVLANVYDWYDYFFEPVIRSTKVVFENLPIYGAATLEITMTASGSTVKCAEIIMGLSRSLGDTQWGVRIGATDYSRKDENAFGNIVLRQGTFHDRMELNAFVLNELVDETVRLLNQYRATPMLYVAGTYASTVVFGFHDDYDTVLQSPAGSFLSLSIKGL